MKIKIQSLEVSGTAKVTTQRGYLYKDLRLDLIPAYSINRQLNRKEYLRDVQASYDVEAIKNSIANAFMTSPGQKILNPTFGVDLRRYLFEPVDIFTTDMISDDITRYLPDAEPRIKIVGVSVIPDIDNQQYLVDLQINVPSLNITGLSVKARLDSAGFTVL